MRRIIVTITLAAGLAVVAGPTYANIQIGQTAPNFTKSRLGGGTTSLTDYPGKVVVLFLFGSTCPVCIADCPRFQTDIQQYYATNYPGQVQVLGADSWNGTVNQVTNFRDETGASFPLLLNGTLATGGNLDNLYGPFDNYIVISKQGIVRYHAANLWPHGNRQHINEIRGSVDSLVSSPLAVDETPGRGRDEVMLASSPNPFRSTMSIELSLPVPAARARVALHDISGRRIATLHEGALRAGITRLEWNAAASGADMAPGIYLLAAELDGRRLQRRVVKLP
ncbi:MAG: redoxin domain-containing protein [Candidatus Eisenbacteria bacterium]